MEGFLLGLYVCVGRLMDMTLSSFRVTLVVKRKKLLAALVGFAEATIWFLVVKEAMNTEIESVFIILGYALGFASGTFLGTLISSFFDKCKLCVQIITSSKNDELINALKEANVPLSIFNCKGAVDDHYMIYVVIDSKQLPNIKSIIESHDEKAFIIVNDNKQTINGSFVKFDNLRQGK